MAFRSVEIERTFRAAHSAVVTTTSSSIRAPKQTPRSDEGRAGCRRTKKDGATGTTARPSSHDMTVEGCRGGGKVSWVDGWSIKKAHHTDADFSDAHLSDQTPRDTRTPLSRSLYAGDDKGVSSAEPQHWLAW